MTDSDSYLLGRTEAEAERLKRQIMTLAPDSREQLDRLGIDYLDRRAELISGVTKNDIARIARRLLDAGKLSAVIVGDPEGF